jgi:hypothetical protein
MYLPDKKECGYGWYGLVFSFVDKVEKHAKKIGKEIKVKDIKEKYGSLRFDLDYYDDYLENLEERFITESKKICEKCGSVTGVKQAVLDGWIKTLCEECEQEWRERGYFI